MCRKQRCRKQIIGNTVCHFGNNVGRCRHNHKQVGPIGKGNMFNVKFLIGIPHGNSNFIAADFLKSQRSYKLLGMFCHNDTHFCTLFAQFAHQVNGFINGNAACYT